MKLHKTTIVIWSEYDPQQVGGTGEHVLEWIGRDAESGDAYCSRMTTVAVDDPEHDSDWDGTEFFDLPDDET